MVTRNRIVNVDPIAFVPPSFEAGCGGIDLFGGSFSFINAEQFTNLLRGIASNAAGKGPVEKTYDNAPAEAAAQFEGNLVWKALTECRSPTKETVVLAGMIARVRDLLIGDVSGAGLVQKFMLGVEQLTAEEQGFLEHAPWGLGGAVRTLAVAEPGLAFAFAERVAPIIAIELVQVMVRDMLKSVRLATAGLDHTHTTQLLQQLEAVRTDIWSEYDTLAARYGNPNDLLESFRSLLATHKGAHYLDLMQANSTLGDAEP